VALILFVNVVVLVKLLNVSASSWHQITLDGFNVPASPATPPPCTHRPRRPAPMVLDVDDP